MDRSHLVVRQAFLQVASEHSHRHDSFIHAMGVTPGTQEARNGLLSCWHTLVIQHHATPGDTIQRLIRLRLFRQCLLRQSFTGELMLQPYDHETRQR